MAHQEEIKQFQTLMAVCKPQKIEFFSLHFVCSSYLICNTDIFFIYFLRLIFTVDDSLKETFKVSINSFV